MSSVTTTCRDVNELSRAAQNAIKLFFQECHKAGIAIFVTETYRSQERQNYLYEQGRTRPGQIVTWTKNSNHKSRLAWDIGAAQLDGNTDIYNTTIIKKAGVIANKLGITWGGNWVNNLDYPHFEVKSDWKIPNGYKLDESIVIPTGSKQRVQLSGKVEIIEEVKKEMSFTSNTLKESYENRHKSPNTAKLLDDMAIKHLGYSSKLKDGKMAEGDLNAIALELAVLFAKSNKQ